MAVARPLSRSASAREAMEFEALLHRVRSGFNEMPGLRLTAVQAHRLWAVDAVICEQGIDALLRGEFVRRTASGVVRRN